MAGGTITRIALGRSTAEIEEDFDGYYQTLTMYAGKENIFNAKVTNHGSPKNPRPAGKYFVKGWWTDVNDKPIKKALIGDTVKFHIQMDKTKVPKGSKITFTLLDWDGMLNFDDPIKLYSKTKNPKTNTYTEINKIITDAYGKASLYVTLSDGLVKFMEVDGGDELELYFDCKYYNESDKETEQLDLPNDFNNYLIAYEKEVLITVFVELPHSNESGWGAKGLAGHSAMAVGERYFDYGPDNTPGTYSESQYDVDFNEDGDKSDNVYLSNPSFKYAPGRPWWGKMVSDSLGINASDVKLSQVKSFILQHWSINNVYGEVHTIEFYVKESEAKKMINWWEELYKHLKIYSVKPWIGEQCTTAVKSALQEAFPFEGVKNWIDDATQKPSGLLSELEKFISTSKQHKDQIMINTVIKKESSD